MSSRPPSAITSASPSFWQVMPRAPAAACILARTGLLCVLMCGRLATPARSHSSCTRAMLRSTRSRSMTTQGVPNSPAIWLLSASMLMSVFTLRTPPGRTIASAPRASKPARRVAGPPCRARRTTAGDAGRSPATGPERAQHPSRTGRSAVRLEAPHATQGLGPVLVDDAIAEGLVERARRGIEGCHVEADDVRLPGVGPILDGGKQRAAHPLPPRLRRHRQHTNVHASAREDELVAEMPEASRARIADDAAADLGREVEGIRLLEPALEDGGREADERPAEEVGSPAVMQRHEVVEDAGDGAVIGPSRRPDVHARCRHWSFLRAPRNRRLSSVTRSSKKWRRAAHQAISRISFTSSTVLIGRGLTCTGW